MFSNNFVLAIKVKGKVLREVNDLVYLPFGSEYTILLKNTSTKRAKVKVDVDGLDVTENVHLIVNAGETLELQRFIRNGNLNAGNAFKFIEKTKQIENHRGNKVDDGLITIHYEFEYNFDYADCLKQNPWLITKSGGCCGSPTYPIYGGILNQPIFHAQAHTQDNTFDDGHKNVVRSFISNASIGGSLASSNLFSITTSATSDQIVNYSAEVKGKVAPSVAKNEVGITAPGSEVKQEFKSVSGFSTDGKKYTMTIMLKGDVGQQKVKEAVVVKKSCKCNFCGNQAKQTAKYCSGCGAALALI